jgi:prophage regulatory protein
MSEFERYIRWKELKQDIPFSRSTVYRMILDGRFPKPVRIGKHATAWMSSEIKKWMREREDAR